jgi:hypothetical protein
MTAATNIAASPKAKPAVTKKPASPEKEKPEAMSGPELAELLSKNRKERVRKSFIRKTLDDAKWPKRDGKRYFLPNEIEKAKKIVLDALKGEQS